MDQSRGRPALNRQTGAEQTIVAQRREDCAAAVTFSDAAADQLSGFPFRFAMTLTMMTFESNARTDFTLPARHFLVLVNSASAFNVASTASLRSAKALETPLLYRRTVPPISTPMSRPPTRVRTAACENRTLRSGGDPGASGERFPPIRRRHSERHRPLGKKSSVVSRGDCACSCQTTEGGYRQPRPLRSPAFRP
jgi:hypothetical protein